MGHRNTCRRNARTGKRKIVRSVKRWIDCSKTNEGYLRTGQREERKADEELEGCTDRAVERDKRPRQKKRMDYI